MTPRRSASYPAFLPGLLLPPPRRHSTLHPQLLLVVSFSPPLVLLLNAGQPAIGCTVATALFAAFKNCGPSVFLTRPIQWHADMLHFTHTIVPQDRDTIRNDAVN
ncbi:hypothetical protein DPEC_G00278700 [Dallia pectoralis]|uniref:Uncharacterized protein n=1 Tax=Dallia pectoralis TaxID=75939 RepID=A0ACC2FM64_DALPE|nr:hypothetical protein DPEC_G00278700 [Dallia pectoralis]